MADKIRVGIVGATVTQGGSGWGANAHVPALKALPSYELKAVCTAHEDTAKASAAAFGAELAFHRFSDMAAHPDVDLLVVCVRVPGHREPVVAGLQAGKPVFCEWPLGKNLAEAEEMAGLARQRALPSIVGLQGRSDPTILYARDLINDGYIGEVDLWPLFANPKGPLTEPFADRSFFQQVYVDPESRVVAWPNGYDICSDVLRYYCEQGRVTSRDQMNAYFTEETQASVLRDQPNQN